MRSHLKLFTLFIGLGFIYSCGNDEPVKTGLDVYNSSYELIQGEIWDTQCTSCHTAGSSFAKQSDLVLTSDVSYEQLISRTPANEAAASDGLELVGVEGLESLYKSFLWEKINAPDIAHFQADHPEYGSLMPLGGDYLTNGELEFIRQWIVAGAPKEGEVADRDVLSDDTRFEQLPFEALAPPTSGYSFHVDPFEIPANSDREVFIYQEIENETPIYVSQIEISMAPGSHHFILYGFPSDFATTLEPRVGDIRDVYKLDGTYDISTLIHTQYHEFVAGTQWPNLKYNYPEGVALKLPSNYRFDMNSHYANRTDETVIGEVYANIHTVDESQVEHVAEVLQLNYQDFRLPAGKITIVEKSYDFNETIQIFQLFSHAHEHMTEFKVYLSEGSNEELVYITDDWEHPPILQLDPPLELPVGSDIRLEVTYDNWEDHDLQFGLRSTDEMMILFGAYYK